MDALIIPLVALGIPIIIAPVAIISKESRRKRELEHIERIRALELGRVLPQDEPWWTPARLVGMIAGAVPLASMAIAIVATTEIGFREEIWITCGAVAVSGVVGGTYIAGKYLFGSHPSESLNVKGHFDPDAYDVVGRRG